MERFFYFLITCLLFACNTGGSELISKQNIESRIAFVSNRSGKFIMNADGSEIENLTQDSIECYSPDWTADGKQLIFTAGLKGNYNLYSIDIESKTRKQLTRTDGRNEGPSCSR